MEHSTPLVASNISHPEELHRSLTRLAHLRLVPRLPDLQPQQELHQEMRLRLIELDFLEGERRQIAKMARLAPSTPEGFFKWLQEVRQHGPGQGDALFPWLEHHATWEEFRWFLHQEIAGEAGFDDLVSLTQLRMPPQEKLELARNYWDEMGRGQQRAMHGPMLEKLSRAFALDSYNRPVVWEAQAVGNLLAGLAANRGFAFHALGALGAVELTAPTRACYVSRGLKRLGLHGKTRQYFAVHASLDVKHADAWIKEIFMPVVRREKALALPLAEGILMRLAAGARAFVRYRKILWGGLGQRPPTAADMKAN